MCSQRNNPYCDLLENYGEYTSLSYLCLCQTDSASFSRAARGDWSNIFSAWACAAGACGRLFAYFTHVAADGYEKVLPQPIDANVHDGFLCK